MKQFLKFTLAAAAGLMLGVFSIIIIFSILAASGDSKEVQLDKPYVLRLELNGEIQDRVEEMPFDLSEMASINKARNNGNSKRAVHNWKLATNYTYNSLNQLTSQKSPDGGLTRFWYDDMGRNVLSQNAKQSLDNLFL